jgi:curli production assembly/transport component CsgE
MRAKVRTVFPDAPRIRAMLKPAILPTARRLCLALAWTLAAGSAAALEEGVLENGPPLETPGLPEKLDGVLLDHTMTRIGREFYQAFVEAWRELGEVDSISLALYERPSARWGSRIWVEHKSGRLYQVFLHPGRQRAREAGEQAAAQVFQRVGQMEVEKTIFKDPDLGDEEL